MSSALAILAYGLMTVFAAGPALAHTRWTSKAPRLAIVAWHLLCVTTVIALLLAGLMLSLSLPYIGATVASVVDLCTSSLQHLYGAFDRHTASVAAILLLLLMPLRLAYVGMRISTRSRKRSKRLRGLLEPLAKPAPGCDGALMIDHHERYAFCLADRGARVVVTSALVADLSPAQLRAVLAHEQAHIRQRHHLALVVPRVLNAAFGVVLPLFVTAEREVARLVELSADDAARAVEGSQALAGALRQMSQMPAGGGVLAATAVAVEERLRRLNASRGQLEPVQALVVGVTMTVVAITPFFFAIAPVVTSAWHDLCYIS